MTGYNAQMRNGTPVFGIEPHMGLLRGQYIAGTAHNGDPFMRALCWYEDGSFSVGGETEYDLVDSAPIDNQSSQLVRNEFLEDLF